MEDEIEKVWQAINDWFDASGSENDDEYFSVCHAFNDIVKRLEKLERNQRTTQFWEY